MSAELVAEAWERCQRSRPDVVVSLERFRAHLDAHRPPEVTLEEQLATWCIDDVYLVAACVAGDPGAISAVEREVVPIIDRALATWDAALVAETRQRLRVMLMVDHAGRGPLLAQYGGRGALRRWIRVVAAREASKTRQADAAMTPVDDDALFDALAPAGDPALSAVRRDATTAFRTAFLEALTELEPRERTALRMHILDGLSIDEIAPMFDVHRATVARWIAAAKDRVLGGTRRRLMRQLGLDASEVESLIRVVDSRIELPSALLVTKP